MKYPAPFTNEELLKIDQITRCPDFLYKGYGVFLNCNNHGIQKDDIRLSYNNKLSFISLNIFQQATVNYGRENY